MGNSRLRNICLVIIFVLLACAEPLITSRFYKFVLALAVINVIMVTGLHVIFGLTGQIFMGMAGFWGIGSYLRALATTIMGLGFWPALILSSVGVGFMGLVLGIPTLRLKGYYLSITTIGFGEITRFILMNWSAVTGGVFGCLTSPAALRRLCSHQRCPFLLLQSSVGCDPSSSSRNPGGFQVRDCL